MHVPLGETFRSTEIGLEYVYQANDRGGFHDREEVRDIADTSSKALRQQRDDHVCDY